MLSQIYQTILIVILILCPVLSELAWQAGIEADCMPALMVDYKAVHTPVDRMLVVHTPVDHTVVGHTVVGHKVVDHKVVGHRVVVHKVVDRRVVDHRVVAHKVVVHTLVAHKAARIEAVVEDIHMVEVAVHIDSAAVHMVDYIID